MRIRVRRLDGDGGRPSHHDYGTRGSNGHIIRSTTLYSFRYNSIDRGILSDVLRPSYLGIIGFDIEKEDIRDSNSRWLAFGAGVLLAIDFAGYHSAIDYIGSGIATMIGNSPSNHCHISELVVIW